MSVVLVTGATRGIGLALAEAYARRGDPVIAAVRPGSDRSRIDALAERRIGFVTVAEMDACRADDIARVKRQFETQPIDILINNAGVAGPERQSALDMDFDGLLETLEVNAVGPLRVCKAFLPNVKAARGKIVTISSQMGSMQTSAADALAYRASKAALNKLMQGLATQLKPQGVPVLSVHPGWVRTDMGGADAPLSPEESAAGLLTLIDRLDIASTGRFLDWSGRALAW